MLRDSQIYGLVPLLKPPIGDRCWRTRKVRTEHASLDEAYKRDDQREPQTSNVKIIPSPPLWSPPSEPVDHLQTVFSLLLCLPTLNASLSAPARPRFSRSASSPLSVRSSG